MPRESYRDTGLTTGKHKSSSYTDRLYDDTKMFSVLDCIGRLLSNDTDGSSGVIFAQTDNTVSATLSGGATNIWTENDKYTIYVTDTGNAVLSTTWICKKSGFSFPRTMLIEDEHPKFT